MKHSSLSIIAGSHRSRHIHFSPSTSVRPTPNRLRETLFNWLRFDIINGNVLDLFSGSGALAFEALSRGAKSAVLVEKDKRSYLDLLDNQKKLQFNDVVIVNDDAFAFLKHTQSCFDIVFLDPPFQNFSLDKIMQNMGVVVKKTTKIYFESNKMPLSIPKGWRVSKESKASSVYGLLLESEN